MAHNEHCLRPNEALRTNEWLRSSNGLFHAVMQEDSNFAIYRGDWKEAGINTHLWSTVVNDCNGKPYAGAGQWYLWMQGDGNLIISVPGGGPVWALTTHHNDVMAPGSMVILQDDGNLFVGPNGDGSKFRTNVTDTIDESSLQMEEMVYDLLNAKITQIGNPGHSSSNIAGNSTSINQSVTLSMSYTKSKTTSWKTSTTLKWGAKTSFKCGVPSLAEGKVEVNTELAVGFEYNESKTETESVTISLPVVVPPGKKVIGRCTWKESRISIPFKVVGKAKFKGCSALIPIHISGVYEGVQTHDVETMFSEISDEHPDLRFWHGAQREIPIAGGG